MADGSIPMETNADLVGCTLHGGWQIVRHIGSGAMGEVYEARHTEDGPARAAVKVLHQRLLDEPEIAFRFRREAEILELVRSPHVPRLFDRGKDPEGRPFLVLEFLAGRELSAILDETWPLDPMLAVEIASQICRALSAAHRAGVVHRDLKPDNIMVCGPLSAPEVKVLDFGVSKVEDVALTVAGAVIGTPSYMAPEQALGGETTTLVDVYAVGAVLFEMVTGSPPFDEVDPGKTLAALLTTEPPLPTALNRNLDKALEAIILRATARQASARYGSVDALESELALWSAQARTHESEGDRVTLTHPLSLRSPATTNPPGLVATTQASSRWVYLVLGIALLLAVTALVLVLR